MSRNVLRCRGIRKLQSLLLLGALSSDHVHVTTNAGFRKENDEKRQEEKREVLLAVAEPSSPFWIYTCRYKTCNIDLPRDNSRETRPRVQMRDCSECFGLS